MVTRDFKNMQKRYRNIMSALGLIVLFFTSTAIAAANPWQMNMYRGVTPLSKDMYFLHMIALIICALIGVVVFGVMIYALIYHRKSRGAVAASFHSSTRIEILWSIIPFLILIALAVPATKILIRLEDSRESDVTIKVVGYQWKWLYQYLDQGISYFSNLSTPYAQIQNQEPKGMWYLLEVDKPLVVPINKKIRFLVTSNDVIHSWWVPELGVKRDAMPGFMHEAWATISKPGTYRGQCAELCGINHAYMPIVVKAVEQAEFEQWVAEQPKVQNPYEQTSKQLPAENKMPRAKLLALGQEKYEQVCSACHRPDGTGIPPMYPPLKGSSVATGQPISRHINMILNGVPGTAMQAYKDQLTNAEIAAIATYERNAWGNDTNDEVQPADVEAARQSSVQASPKMVKVNKASPGGLR